MLLRPGRHAFSISVAVVLLAGCGGQTVSTATIPRVATLNAEGGLHGTSWMKPAASSGDLLYVSGGIAESDVYVFTYPEGQLVGSLTGFYAPRGECVDAAGNVWIANQQPPEVIEYPHGGTTPIATLTTGSTPTGCAVDPTTGNLAVLLPQSEEVSIFPKAQGPPTIYKAHNVGGLYLGGYDNRGNFFSVGYCACTSGKYALVELPKGGSRIRAVSFNEEAQGLAVQWDGKYLAVGGFANHQSVPIDQVKVSGRRATVVNRIELKNHWETSAGGQFWIQGDRVTQACHSSQSICIWRYPGGGYPLKTIKSAIPLIWGITVSLASSRR